MEIHRHPGSISPVRVLLSSRVDPRTLQILPAFGESDVAILLSNTVFAISVEIQDMLEVSCRNKEAVGTTVRDCRTKTYI